MSNNVNSQATPEQKQAWEYYGEPRLRTKGGAPDGKNAVGKQVGEVRYIIGWMADQMVRMGWRVTVGGSESWELRADGGNTVKSDPRQTDPAHEDHPINASKRILLAIDWNERTVREVTTNLFVAGELDYAFSKDKWRVISVIRSDREELLKSAKLNVRGIWPHPADPEAPDAPLFGVLGVLSDMYWLNRLSRSQSANRAGMRGIIGVANEITTAQGEGGEAFWSDFEASLSRPIDDPEDVSPVGIRGPQALVEPKEGGMKGLAWIIPDFPYDDKVDERMHHLVRRLAYGLPVPPEILLGLQAQSKATAFQVEGATYRAHIEPVAMLVSKVATDAMGLLLADAVGEIEVTPDPTPILTRRHSVSDVLEAYDRGAASQAYLREVLGIPERAAMTEDELKLWMAIQGKSSIVDGVKDPANDAADEPISAAVAVPSGDAGSLGTQQSPGDEYLSELLHRIDLAALHELVGAADQAVATARERIGGHIRSSERMRSHIPKSVANAEIMSELGSDVCIAALGAKAASVIGSSISTTLTWWGERVDKARGQAASVLEDAGVTIEFSGDTRERSVEALRIVLTESIETGKPIKDAHLRKVLEIAGKQ